METIQVVLDRKLLRAADSAARRARQNRSALIRDALRAHLRKLQIRALEDQERAAYSRQPASVEESLMWEGEAAWPSE
jgi:metal-responsive CopG/Arc/MetJ family transcriptional regulator